MEERKEIDIPAIFEKIKELDNEKKMQLKRAANVSFENLQTTQRITFFNLLDDDSMGKAKSEFLIHMMSMFVKQDCQTGNLLKNFWPKCITREVPLLSRRLVI